MKSLLVALGLTLVSYGGAVAAETNPEGYFVVLTSFAGSQPFPKIAKVGNRHNSQLMSLNCESGFGHETAVFVSCGDPIAGPVAGGLLNLYSSNVVSGVIQFRPEGTAGTVFLSCEHAAPGADIECR